MSSYPTSLPRWTEHLVGLNQSIVELVLRALEDANGDVRNEFELSHDAARRLERLTASQQRLFVQLTGNAPIFYLKETAGFHEMLSSARSDAPLPPHVAAQLLQVQVQQRAGVYQLILEVMRVGLDESGEMARLFFGLSVDVAEGIADLTVPQVRRLAQLMAPGHIIKIKGTAGFDEMLSLAEENAPLSDGVVAQMAHSIGRATG